jgi:hypothetical protein
VAASGTTADVDVLRPELYSAAPAISTKAMIAAIQAMLLAFGELRARCGVRVSFIRQFLHSRKINAPRGGAFLRRSPR